MLTNDERLNYNVIELLHILSLILRLINKLYCSLTRLMISYNICAGIHNRQYKEKSIQLCVLKYFINIYYEKHLII